MPKGQHDDSLSIGTAQLFLGIAVQSHYFAQHETDDATHILKQSGAPCVRRCSWRKNALVLSFLARASLSLSFMFNRTCAVPARTKTMDTGLSHTAFPKKRRGKSSASAAVKHVSWRRIPQNLQQKRNRTAEHTVQISSVWDRLFEKDRGDAINWYFCLRRISRHVWPTREEARKIPRPRAKRSGAFTVFRRRRSVIKDRTVSKRFPIWNKCKRTARTKVEISLQWEWLAINCDAQNMRAKDV